jgi:hypothetical protein
MNMRRDERYGHEQYAGREHARSEDWREPRKSPIRDYGSRRYASDWIGHQGQGFGRHPDEARGWGRAPEVGGYGQQRWAGDFDRDYTGQRMSGGMYGSQHAWQHGGQHGWQPYGSQPYGSQSYRGMGPKGFRRSDERLREQVCEALTDNDEIDASDVEVMVKEGEVTLSGIVEDRRMKLLAERIAESFSGINEVQNTIRIRRPEDRSRTPAS